MGKIVVLAGTDDQEAVKAALDGASLDYEVVEPTAANLLHIAIGMVDENPEEETPPEDEEPAPPADTEPKPDKTQGGAGGTPKGDIPPESDADIGKDASAVPENLIGTVQVGGETVRVYRGTQKQTVLCSPNLEVGSRTVYTINESRFAFWPWDTKKPVHRVALEHNTHTIDLEVQVQSTKLKEAFLVAGTDISDLFKTK